MASCFFSLLAFFSAFNFFGSVTNETKWVIVSGCWLKVDGNTNINNFSCEIVNYSNPDTIIVTKNNTAPVQLNGNIRLAVQNFDCHHSIMTADLRKTLKAKEFPHLIIRFISINKYPDANAKQDIKGMVEIQLAGIFKRFEVDYKVTTASGTFINLVGSRKINFSDFNIVPPRKLGGMIKTNDELSVVFNLRMKVID